MGCHFTLTYIKSSINGVETHNTHKEKIRTMQSTGKALLSALGDVLDIPLLEFLDHGGTESADCYCTTLQHLACAREQSCPHIQLESHTVLMGMLCPYFTEPLRKHLKKHKTLPM
jgi:hypothetical protein